MGETSLEGKVAIVTGAGRGIGREEALALAAAGARVVVNDLGSAWTGEGSDRRPAEDVVAEIEAAGGSAVANFDDVTDPAAAERLVQQAIDTFGDLDILVNNAGILRDGMVFSIDPQQWQSVVNVHLMGHFLPTRAATAYWREQAKAGDSVPHRTIVNTSSESGLFGNAAQSNYDAAKLGIASFTIAVAKETAKYNVTCNAIAPRARTRLTTTTFSGSSREGEFGEVAEDVFDAMDPANIAPFVAYLATDHASDITGQTFIVYGGIVGRVRMPHLDTYILKDGRWTIEELVEAREGLFGEFAPGHFEGPKGFARLPRH
jgi:NAD(P)-dependent dehydrogenase (short-subunit alcohol dehydrogenase family)